MSVYMITYNNAKTIEKALLSVAGWAEDIVVVDSHSDDGTAETAEKLGIHVSQYDTTDLREKYQYAQDQCANPWVLFIDADEWLTPRFRDEVEKRLASETQYDGFMVKRRNIYLGREIKHGGWYPDHEIRLYRKDKGGWQGGIHAKVHVDGKVGKLKSYYMHTPYGDTSHQIHTIDRYSGAYAEDLFAARKHFRLFNMITRPLYRFFRDYIFKLGFLDGIPGLIIIASTMYYVFMKQGKLWEIEKNQRDTGNS